MYLCVSVCVFLHTYMHIHIYLTYKHIPELAGIKEEIEEIRQERKEIKAEISRILGETAEASERVTSRVTRLEAIRAELEPGALYAAYGAEVVVSRCQVRSSIGSGVLAEMYLKYILTRP